MKKLFICFALFFISYGSYSQFLITEGKTSIQSNKHPAAIAEMPYPVAVVEAAIDEYMASKGTRGSESKGVRIFRSHVLAPAYPVKNDLYFKVEKKSRQEKDMSIVYLVIAKTGADFKAGGHEEGVEPGKILLQDMAPFLEDYFVTVQVREQEEFIKKVVKKSDALVETQKDLEKKKKSLDEQIAENLKKQEDQKAELEKQNGVLESIKLKRKTKN
ncbi:MAG: hypothetical protein H7Y27_10440 [Gemmatimonadaceae bacterium]|nr:hypothetical protein [Chitinophagaceae bacterium]